jgi:hypothetical protein
MSPLTGLEQMETTLNNITRPLWDQCKTPNACVYRASGNKKNRTCTRKLFACPDTIGPSGP